MVLICDEYTKENYNEYFSYFNFPLSNFQKWALESIVTGNHCLVTAHTGSGKTLPAEFAIQYFKEQGKKVIYTGPIKALCNQKLYDFRNKYPHISFGLLTGDIKDNPEADVLIMTTEILRNTLFNKQIIQREKEKLNNNVPSLSFEMDFDSELAAVVFDEVHYIGDEDRGSVWEQSIMLLPTHVQLIMLSATIDKPENFARWVEDQKKDKNEKIVYLCSTYERVVPLTHYMWLSCHQNTIKDVKGTELESEFKTLINNPILITDTNKNFNDINYDRIKKIEPIIEKKGYIKRQFVLNSLIKYLKNNNMIPALCFVFSRKNVETCAKEINFSLFDKDDKTPNIIENECKQILIRKLNNYKEYINLPEYLELMELLKKGIAIHHAGLMPILREIVELLFEKNYIKLLFATETFAVGINMPTKTVIFSSLAKFDGNGMRELYSHEYTQMAGRAGRRGIDTVGHVIHCNNLFKLDSVNQYKKMMTGGAKMLTSKFKISFNLLLNIIYSNDWSEDFNIENFKEFVGKSMIKDNIEQEINHYQNKELEVNNRIKLHENIITNLKTPKNILEKYNTLISQKNLRNNQKKKNQREITILESEYDIKNDSIKYNEYLNIIKEQEDNLSYKNNIIHYIENNIQNVLKILIDNNFITANFKILEKGIISSQLQEVHSLVMGELYIITGGFTNFSAVELVCIFSCFTNINVDDTLRTYQCSNYHLQTIFNQLGEIAEKYDILQTQNYIPNDTETNLHMDLVDFIYNWCLADNESLCRDVISQVKNEKNIFLGDFVKAIIKINNIAKEFDKICEIMNNMELKEKISQIEKLTLKYIATNQSLYI